MNTNIIGRLIMSPDKLGKRLACKYPTRLWHDINGVITCPMCGDTLNVFYVWQMILIAIMFLDMGAIWFPIR